MRFLRHSIFLPLLFLFAACQSSTEQDEPHTLPEEPPVLTITNKEQRLPVQQNVICWEQDACQTKERPPLQDNIEKESYSIAKGSTLEIQLDGISDSTEPTMISYAALQNSSLNEGTGDSIEIMGEGETAYSFEAVWREPESEQVIGWIQATIVLDVQETEKE